MKRNYKTILFALTAAMIAPIVGCGGSKTDEAHTIKIWTTFNDDYGAIITKVKKSFEKKYPEYKVSYKKINGGYNDLAADIEKGASAGDIPDMAALYPDSMAKFLDLQIGMNIEKYMKDEEIGWTDEDFDDIPEGYITEGQSYVLPGTYSLPICKSTEAMFYDKDALVNNGGLDLSSYDDTINDGDPLTETYMNNLTWDELFDHLLPAIEQYIKDNPSDTRFSPYAAKYETNGALFGYDSDDNMFITLAEQYGYGYTSVNSTTGKGSIDFVVKNDKGEFAGITDDYYNLISKLYAAAKARYLTTSAYLGERVNYVFTTGGMLMSIGSTGGTKYQFSTTHPLDVGVARIPQADPDNGKIINQGPSVVFLRNPKIKKDAEKVDIKARGMWLFYKEWTSKDYATEWTVTTNYAPIRKSTGEDPVYLAKCDENAQTLKTAGMLNARTFKYVAEVSDNLFGSPVFTNSGKARTAVSGIFSDVFKLTTLTRSAVEDIFSRAYSAAI